MPVFAAIALLIFGGVLLLVTLSIGVMLVAAVPQALWIAAQGVDTVGEIASVRQATAGRSTVVRIAYTTPGGNFEARGTARGPRMGAQVPVRYRRSRPSAGTTFLHPLRWTAVGIPAVIVSAAISVGMLTGAVWCFSGTHKSLQQPLGGGCFMLAIALGCVYYAANRYAISRKWHRMVQTEGKVQRHKPSADQESSGQVLISFTSAEGNEEFWVQAKDAPLKIGDAITVYYDPAKPVATATVHDVSDIRSAAMYSVGFAILTAALGIWSLSAL